jgi:hypothetical protein
MTMPSPPSQHATGDPGHTGDHNTIATLLGDLQTAVEALQGLPLPWALGGSNVSALSGTTVSWGAVSVTAVNRDGGADIFDVYYGSQKIFSLNSYGELRLTAAQLTHVAQVISTLSGQSADAWQIQSPASTPLARVGPDGSASFQGPVSLWTNGAVAAWQHPALQNSWVTYSGRTLACKLTNDNMVQITGQLVPGEITNGTVVAQLPAGCAPLYRPEPVPAATYDINQEFSGQNDAGVYFEAETSGLLKVYSLGSGSGGSNYHVVLGGRYPLDAQ